MPALPLDEAGRYVAAAYVFFVALLLVYVAIMAAKLQRIDRRLDELAELAEERGTGTSDGVAARHSEPGVPVASQPAGSGHEAEHRGGGATDG
jgi:hypothetical protein